MTKGKSTLIVIPARGGSKRLPRKNTLILAGKPLIVWSIESAISADLDGDIVVSSDDDEVLSIARRYSTQGVVCHRRPASLASDEASMASVLLDLLENQRQSGHFYETLVLLQPTSPLRHPSDISAAIARYVEFGKSSTVVSVCRVDHPTAWTGIIDSRGLLKGVDFSPTRSQSYVAEYRLNGAVYCVPVATLEEHGSLFSEQVISTIMPRDRSVDIDDENDFRLAQVLITASKMNKQRSIVKIRGS